MPPSSPPDTDDDAPACCPHCHAPGIHIDARSGDTLCTTCGIVLSSHLLDCTPEWRDYDNDDPASSLAKQRCGAPVDEGQWRGGLMPTTLGKVPYIRTGNSEESRRLGGLRKRLMKTNALIEQMMERQWKEQYDEVALERKVREARRERGEAVESDLVQGTVCHGDYEELMARDRTLDKQVMTPLRDRKWVITDAILLHGSFEEVQSHISKEEGWTPDTLEKERSTLTKSLDATSRSTAAKLYVAFALLSRASRKLELDGRILTEMSKWLMEYAKKRELRVKGISKEGNCGTNIRGGNEGFTLSLIEQEEIIAFNKTSAASWSNIDLHRLRQYASLSAAIAYLAAKRNGKGRTLAEVCAAFGSFRISPSMVGGGGGQEPLVRPKYCSKAMQELRAVLPGAVVGSTAASSAAVPANVNVGVEDGFLKTEASSTISSFSPVQKEATNRVLTPIKTEARASSNGGSTSVVSLSSNSTTSTLSPVPETSNHRININNISSKNIISNAEDEALADLTSRVGRSLDLPPCAIVAAVAMAIQCSSDASAPTNAVAKPAGRNTIRPPIRRGNNKNPLFIVKNRGGRGSYGVSAVSKREGSPDVIAAASILLVCMAGQKMQILARQAVNRPYNIPTNESIPIIRHRQDDMLLTSFTTLSNPFDDLADELTSSKEITDTTCMDSHIADQTAPKSRPAKQSSIELWAAWNRQPPWHREVSQIEKCTGVSSKTIVSYYSNVLHPRRSYFLDVARKRSLSEHEMMPPRKRIKTENVSSEEGPDHTSSLLRNFAAASPLISLRGL
ncbi:hypothetical protein ACHAW6_008376 [Cyclotella cf. meneghiniana]